MFQRRNTLFALTNTNVGSYVGGMTIEQTLQIIQVTYPQVYLACHTRHQRKRSTEHHLSARDSSILAHLDEHVATTPAQLAAHLGVARSTLSEALKSLTALGFVQRSPRVAAGGQRGGVGMYLTAKGVDAIRDTSVLEAARLRVVLSVLTTAERRDVARGLSVLARACVERGAAFPDFPEIDP